MKEFEELVEKLIDEQRINGKEAMILLRAGYKNRSYDYPSYSITTTSPSYSTTYATAESNSGSLTTRANTISY
jgi:hypothetical protein